MHSNADVHMGYIDVAVFEEDVMKRKHSFCGMMTSPLRKKELN